MTPLQKAQLRSSEIRSRMADLAGGESTDETRTEIDTLKTEYRDVEVRSQALMVSEDKPTFPENTAEGREAGRLETRSTLAGFISGINAGNLDGAEKEYREAILVEGFKPTDIPLSMLLPRNDAQMEMRAVTPVAAAALSEGAQNTIAGRVFARSVPAFLGIPMPSVPAGSAGYPRLTGGTTFSVQAASGERASSRRGHLRGRGAQPHPGQRFLRIQDRRRGEAGGHRRRLALRLAGRHGQSLE